MSLTFFSNEADMERLSGRVDHRSCTDKLALLIFVLCLAFEIYLLCRIFMEGDSHMLVYGTDSWGNVCNRENEPVSGAQFSGVNTTGLKYQLDFDYYDRERSTKVCVSQCPDRDLNNLEAFKQLTYEDDIVVCRYDMHPRFYIEDCLCVCPKTPLPNQDHIIHRCVPKYILEENDIYIHAAPDILGLKTKCIVAGPFHEQVAADIYNAWEEISQIGSSCIVTCIVIIVIFKLRPSIIVNAIFIIAFLGVFFGICFTWGIFIQQTVRYTNIHVSFDITEQEFRVKCWFFLAILMTMVAIVTFLIIREVQKHLISCQEAISNVSNVFPVAPMLIFQPIVTSVFSILIIKTWFVGYFYMQTIVDAVPEDLNPCRVNFHTKDWVKVMQYFHLIFLYLLLGIVEATQDFVISSSLSTWYFTRDKMKPKGNIIRSIYRALRFHFGSIVYQSVLSAFVKMPKFFVYFSYRFLAARENKLARLIVGNMKWLLAIYNRFLQMVDLHGLHVIAIYGYNYRDAMHHFKELALYNPINFENVGMGASYFLFLMETGIGCLTYVVGIFVLHAHPEICNIWVPVLLLGLFGFSIGHNFIALYSTGMSALLVCYCIDADEHDGIDEPLMIAPKVKLFLHDELHKNFGAQSHKVISKDHDHLAKPTIIEEGKPYIPRPTLEELHPEVKFDSEANKKPGLFSRIRNSFIKIKMMTSSSSETSEFDHQPDTKPLSPQRY